MTQQGPEAILMTAAVASRRGLSDFTRLEYSLADAVRMEASLLRDFEAMPTPFSANLGIFRRGAKLLRRGRAGTGASGSGAPRSLTDTSAGGRSVSAPSLAALPGLREGLGEKLSPLSAIPRVGRA